MAGSRLLLHATFLVQFVLLVSLSAYVGLWLPPQDLICQRIPQWLKSAAMHLGAFVDVEEQMSTTTDGHNIQNPIEFPPIVFTCDERQAVYWQSALWKARTNRNSTSTSNSRYLNVIVRPDRERDLEKVCDDPAAALSDGTGTDNNNGVDATLSDVWICNGNVDNDPSTSSSATPALEVYNTNTILHHESAERSHQILQNLLRFAEDDSQLRIDHQRRVRLYIRMWVPQQQQQQEENDQEDLKKWKLVMNALNRHFQSNRFGGIGYHNWPCLERPPILQVKFLGGEHINNKEMTTIRTDETNETVELVDIHNSCGYLDHLFGHDTPHPKDNEELAVHVLLTSRVPIRFVDTSKMPNTTSSSSSSSSSSMQRGNAYVLAIHMTTTAETNSLDDEEGDYYQQIIDSQLVPVMRRLWKRCMRVPDDDDDDDEGNTIFYADGSFPSLARKLWYQRTIDKLYSTSVSRFLQQDDALHDLVATAKTTWRDDFVLQMQHARNQTGQGHYEQALHHLDRANDILQQHGDTQGVLLDMPLEQYAAIFAPLVLPLMLPLVLGLFREIKRYRQLKEKKNAKSRRNDDTASKED